LSEKLFRITLYDNIEFGEKVSCISINVCCNVVFFLQLCQENLEDNLEKRISYYDTFCDLIGQKSHSVCILFDA
jgi:hypothetical protein